MFTRANPRVSGCVGTSGTGGRTDTARRASGDTTASSQINWTLFLQIYGIIASLVKQKLLRAPRPSGRSRSSFLRFFRQRVRVTRGEEPWIRTRIVHLKPSIPGRGHYRAILPKPGVPRQGYCKPKLPTRPPTDWHRRLLTLLSNIPQCDVLAAPVLFFAVVPFVICRRRRVIFLRGAVYDGRKRQAFKKTIAQWSSSCRRPTQAYTNASVEACAILTPLFGTERSKMPCYLATTPDLRRIPP